jgi:hypothetical protein
VGTVWARDPFSAPLRHRREPGKRRPAAARSARSGGRVDMRRTTVHPHLLPARDPCRLMVVVSTSPAASHRLMVRLSPPLPGFNRDWLNACGALMVMASISSSQARRTRCPRSISTRRPARPAGRGHQHGSVRGDRKPGSRRHTRPADERCRARTDQHPIGIGRAADRGDQARTTLEHPS